MPRILLLILTLACPGLSLAAPDAAISRMMQTPASLFDLFLFRLYESAKCNNVVRNDNVDEADLCLSTIAWDADAEILSVFFRVLPAAEAMDDFVDEDEDGREIIMLNLLHNTARRVGAVDSWGLLHSTPIGHGPALDKAAEKAFRTALAARTKTALSTSYDGKVYVATRHADGVIEFVSR